MCTYLCVFYIYIYIYVYNMCIDVDVAVRAHVYTCSCFFDASAASSAKQDGKLRRDPVDGDLHQRRICALVLKMPRSILDLACPGLPTAISSRRVPKGFFL